MMWDTCPYVDINSVGAGGTAVNVWSESLLRDEQRHEECTDHRCGEHRTGSDKSNVPGNEIGRGEPDHRGRLECSEHPQRKHRPAHDDGYCAEPLMPASVDAERGPGADEPDQRRAAKFFGDAERAQEVRMSKSDSDNAFWARYKNFATTAEAYCAN